ncbi:hypothetical protein D3C81_1996460 [compost metagenome]
MVAGEHDDDASRQRHFAQVNRFAENGFAEPEIADERREQQAGQDDDGAQAQR